MAKAAAVLALLLVVVYTAFALVSGAPLLDAELPGGLPAGNLLTAVAMCSLGGIATILAPRGSHARVFSYVALLAAAAWFPVSAALAGNLSLNFSGERGEAWLVLTLLVLSQLGAALAWAIGLQVLAAIRRASLPSLPGATPE